MAADDLTRRDIELAVIALESAADTCRNVPDLAKEYRHAAASMETALPALLADAEAVLRDASSSLLDTGLRRSWGQRRRRVRDRILAVVRGQ